MHYIANKKFSEGGYRILTGCAMYAYVSHYFYIIVVAVAIIRPFKLDFGSGLAIMLVLVNSFILITYAFFIAVWDLAFPTDLDAEQTIAGDPDDNVDAKPTVKDDAAKDDKNKPEEEKSLLKNEEGKE
jgi:hypothetical protein